jgi:hypothetical protein
MGEGREWDDREFEAKATAGEAQRTGARVEW